MLVSEFISAVRRQGKIPSDISSADILAAGDMEIQGRLIPLLRLSHQEYFVTEATVESVNGRVRLPPRSTMGAVRHVQLVYGDTYQNLPQVELESDQLIAAGGVPGGWYFDGGSIVLLPRGTNGSIRFRYYLRPSKMIVETDTNNVSEILSATETNGLYSLTLANAITTPDAVDVISGGGSHALCAIDVSNLQLTVVAVTAAEVLSPIALTSSTYVIGGDWVAAAGRTPLVPVPEEMFSTLVHRTAYVMLRGLGYEAEAASQKALADESHQDAMAILAPRSEGNPKPLTGGIRRAMGR